MVRLSIIVSLILMVSVTCDDSLPAGCQCVKEEVCKGPYYKPIESNDDEFNCENNGVCCTRKEEMEEEFNCGFYNIDLRRRGNGESVDKGEVPWMTTIRSASSNSFLGSGALVHAGAIVTTASIVHGLRGSDILVHVDADMFLPTDKNSTFGVLRIFRHYSYNNSLSINNIAVLILKRRVVLTNKLRALCLPRQSNSYHSKQPCIFSGWDFTVPEAKRDLRKSEQFVIPNNQCQDELRKSSHFPWWMHLHSSFLCTIPKFPLEEPSKGNAGSLLFCPISDDSSYYVLAGLASWGDGQGVSVFTNVAKFSNWIDEYLGRLHDDIRFNDYRLNEQLVWA